MSSSSGHIPYLSEQAGRSVRRFAYLPKKMRDGNWIWLKHYRGSSSSRDR